MCTGKTLADIFEKDWYKKRYLQSIEQGNYYGTIAWLSDEHEESDKYAKTCAETGNVCRNLANLLSTYERQGETRIRERDITDFKAMEKKYYKFVDENYEIYKSDPKLFNGQYDDEIDHLNTSLSRLKQYAERLKKERAKENAKSTEDEDDFSEFFGV
jgi:hypothetical protein